MKAILLEGFDGPDMLRYGDAPDPSAGPGDVVVDVHAASVNAADYKMRLGSYSDLKFPHILGRDFSGVAAGDYSLQARRCRRGAPGQRGPPPAGQAGVGGAIVA